MALAASVEVAATQFAAQPPAVLSASLGVPIESTAPVAVQTDVVAPLVVAPPPPSLPPAVPPPSSSSDVSMASMASQETLTIALAAGAGLLLLGVAIAVYKCTRMAKRSRGGDVTVDDMVYRGSTVPHLPPKDVEATVNQVSLSTTRL